MYCIYNDYKLVGLREASMFKRDSMELKNFAKETKSLLICTCLRLEVYFEECNFLIFKSFLTNYHIITDSELAYQRLVSLASGFLSFVKFERAIIDQFKASLTLLDKSSKIYEIGCFALKEAECVRMNFNLFAKHDYQDIVLNILKKRPSIFHINKVIILGSGMLAQMILDNLLIAFTDKELQIISSNPSKRLFKKQGCEIIPIKDFDDGLIEEKIILIIATNLENPLMHTVSESLSNKKNCLFVVDFSSSPLFYNDSESYINMYGNTFLEYVKENDAFSLVKSHNAEQYIRTLKFSDTKNIY